MNDDIFSRIENAKIRAAEEAVLAEADKMFGALGIAQADENVEHVVTDLVKALHWIRTPVKLPQGIVTKNSSAMAERASAVLQKHSNFLKKLGLDYEV